MYRAIDNIDLGDVKWSNFTVHYTGARPPTDVPSWMDDRYEVYFRDPLEVVHNMLANPEFSSTLDYCPYREYETETNERRWSDFMSGDWAWNQAVGCHMHKLSFVVLTDLDVVSARISSLRMFAHMALSSCQLS